MNSLPQQGLVRMETIAGRWVAKHEGGESASRYRMSCVQTASATWWCAAWIASLCDEPVRLLQLSPEDGKLTGLHSKLTVTSRSGIGRERGSHLRCQQQRQRPLLDLPARLLQRCEVHECIFSVIPSGVICVLKLCYALPFWWHAHATALCTFSTCMYTRSGSPHNVLHSTSTTCTHNYSRVTGSFWSAQYLWFVWFFMNLQFWRRSFRVIQLLVKCLMREVNRSHHRDGG